MLIFSIILKNIFGLKQNLFHLIYRKVENDSLYYDKTLMVQQLPVSSTTTAKKILSQGNHVRVV